jgi:hypothetical protein
MISVNIGGLMAGSLYLNQLSDEGRKSLIKQLLAQQNGKCFISGKPIDLALHADSIDIDHVIPIRESGKDDPTNFAVTLSNYNRSKQASDLRVARIMYRFEEIANKTEEKENRGPNLGDVLNAYHGAQYHLPVKIENSNVHISLPDLGRNDILTIPKYKDDLSGIEYFFAKLPIEYVYHDDVINPRSIGPNIRGLIEEFYKKRPQLHVALGWIQHAENGAKRQIKIFDGQHKVAAQIMLGVRELPIRIFLNADKDILLTTNTNAGTTLRQVAFDKSVQRRLGSAILKDRIDRFRQERNLAADFEGFSEKELVDHFKGEHRAVARYVIDEVRAAVMRSSENKLTDYIELAGKGTEKPFSYSTIEKTFFSFFIYPKSLESAMNYKVETGENPRSLEKDQIIKLMNIIAERLYIGFFDPEIGTRVESRIQKGEDIKEEHLRGVRMAREEVLYCWLKYTSQIAENFFVNMGKPVVNDRLFQYKFPDTLWDRIRTFVTNMGKLPLWANRELSLTVFGGKQNTSFWQTIFETGSTNQGVKVLPKPINFLELIKDT